MAATWLSNVKNSVVDSLYNAADWVTDLEDNAMKWAAETYVDTSDLAKGNLNIFDWADEQAKNNEEFKTNQSKDNQDYINWASTTDTPLEVIKTFEYENFKITVKTKVSSILKNFKENPREYAYTILMSAGTTVVGFAESTIEGAAFVIGGAIADCMKNEKKAKILKEVLQEMVEDNYAERLYKADVSSAKTLWGWDEEYDKIAYGAAHTVTGAVTNVVLFVALSGLAGEAANAAKEASELAKLAKTLNVLPTAIGACQASESSAQQAFRCGATFEEAHIAATAAAAVSVVAGYGMQKLGTAADAAKTMGQAKALTLAGAAMGAVEPTANVAISYELYGKDMKDKDGKNLSIFDFVDETGAVGQIGMGAIIGGAMTGFRARKAVKVNNVKTVVEVAMETSEFDKDAFNAELDNMSDAERSETMRQFYESEYGAENVEVVSNYEMSESASLEASAQNARSNRAELKKAGARYNNQINDDVDDILSKANAEGRALTQAEMDRLVELQDSQVEMSHIAHASDVYDVENVNLPDYQNGANKGRKYITTEDGSLATKAYSDADLDYIDEFRAKPRTMREVTVGHGETAQTYMTDLTDDELIKFANDQFRLATPITSLEDYPKGGVPTHADSLYFAGPSGTDGSPKLLVEWGVNGGARYGTTQPGVFEFGSEIRRDGPVEGYFVTIKNAGGNQVGKGLTDGLSQQELCAIAYEEGSQTTYTFVVKEKFDAKAVTKRLNGLKDSDPDFYQHCVERYYNNPQEKWAVGYDSEKGFTCSSEIGTIQGDFGHAGGGTQGKLPLMADDLEYLGFIGDKTEILPFS